MTKALISIDYTVDFVADDGKLTAGAPAQAISETIAQVTQLAFDQGAYVFFAIDAHDVEDPFHPESKLFPPHNIIGTSGRDLYGPLADFYREHKADPRVFWMDKRHYSAFSGTDLDIRLRERCEDTVILTGVLTDICVLHTAVDAYNLGYQIEVVEPAVGYLACGDTGAGKMPDPEVLYEYIIKEIACEKDLKGKKIMVTAGPTQEAIDPVRYITNHSTGKMGYAIAKRAMLRGADVTLVSGPVALDPVPFVKMVPVTTAQDMFEAVSGGFPEQDILIKAAAVADYRPSNVSDEKVKKRDGDMAIALERTTDILGYVGEHKKPEQIICGFSMETQNMLENSRKKLKKKHLDMIVANNLKEQGAGFGTDTNRVTIISEKEEKNLELMSKEEVADEILNYILEFK